MAKPNQADLKWLRLYVENREKQGSCNVVAGIVKGRLLAVTEDKPYRVVEISDGKT